MTSMNVLCCNIHLNTVHMSTSQWVGMGLHGLDNFTTVCFDCREVKLGLDPVETVALLGLVILF